ncbi:DUF262 domain-containing HNH endonuclease family protein [Micromonospora sp. NPDC005707]|uniref:DUF262 domain-containing protein n=1 Tax=Micromonospora sp. NPDC005707 TaxID=3157050 RepID=UPI0033C7C703
MDANTYSLKQVLNQERRYVIPTYQRDYEWTRDGQWELLFDDLEAVADRLFDARAHAMALGKSPAKADQRVIPHFLGAIVCDQLPAPAGGIDVRAVIDGQQRLTTLQVLLRGVLDVLIERGSPRVRQVRRLLRNPSDVVNEDYEEHKLWPRRRDRPFWPLAMGDELPSTSHHPYLQARRYFADRARAAITGVEGEDRADSMVDALTDLFKLVVIDLEDNDDAQVIFEVLNGRQTPLSAADLVKNLLFLRGELASEQELDKVYEAYWAPFDDEWWTKSVGRGHATRGRRDTLLSNWLTAVSGNEINVGHLYGEVRRHLNVGDQKTVQVLSELREYGEAYRALYGAEDPGSAALAVSYRRLDRLGISTAVPLLLWLRTVPRSRLSMLEHEAAVLAVESWVVRRIIIGANTRGYGKVFVEVLNAAKRVVDDPGQSIALTVVEALSREAGTLRWPSDGELAEAFVNRKMYDTLTQERIRLLLGAIDARLHQSNPKSEFAQFDYDVLQIEHVMPRSWREYWPLPKGDESAQMLRAQQRDQALHRIGNLTLVTSAFNKSVSNKSWSMKQPELIQHSMLYINKAFGSINVWDEDAIELRAHHLAGVAAEVWPTPAELGHLISGM